MYNLLLIWFIIESLHAFSFVDLVVVYQVFLVCGRCDKLGYEIFIVNVVYMHFSAA